MAKVLGNRVANFTAPTIDPGLAQAEAGMQLEGQLRQEAAALAPDFAEAFDLMAAEDMHTFDREADVHALGELQTNFIHRMVEDPFVAFSPEGKQLARQVKNFMNDPQRARKREAFGFNKDAIEQAQKDGILSDVYVSGGIIGGRENKGVLSTVSDQWISADRYKGGNRRINLTQNKQDESIKRIQDTFSGLGETTTNSFRNFNGAEFGIAGGTVIEKVLRSGNQKAVAKMVDAMRNDGMIASSDWDALVSKAAGEISRSGEYNPETLQDDANKKALGYIATIADAKTDDLLTSSLSNTPGLSDGSGRGANPKTSGFTYDAFNANKETLMIRGDGTGFQVSAAGHTPAQLIGKGVDGSSGVGVNTFFQKTGLTVNNLTVGTVGEKGNKTSPALAAHIMNFGEIDPNGEGSTTFASWSVNGKQVSPEELEFLQKLEANSAGLSPREIASEKERRGLSGAQPGVFSRIQVAFPASNNWFFDGFDDQAVEELEGMGITTQGTYRDDEVLNYAKRMGKAIPSDIDSSGGSNKYVVSIYYPVNPDYNFMEVQAFDQGEKRIIEVAPNSFQATKEKDLTGQLYLD